MKGEISRRAVAHSALETLREEADIIVIRRTASGEWPGYWTVSTARHSTTHSRRELDAEIMVKILMEQQERDMP